MFINIYMYTNIGLGIICKRLSDSESYDIYQEELVRLICPYVGKDINSHIRETLIRASNIFLNESIKTEQNILALFGEWLSNERFRMKCLEDRTLIIEGSGVLEVFPHECVELPALQLIYEYEKIAKDIPPDVLNISNYRAIKHVGRKLESIYINS